MLIFAIDNELYLHANKIIVGGKVKVFNINKEIAGEFVMDQTDYSSFPLNVPAGKYLVRFTCGDEKVERHVFLKKKRINN